MTRRHRPSAGFTLIEAIMVIVITGIVAGMVAVFITKPVQGYVDSVRRAELTDAADVALRRMTRDVRLALPNSLRTTTDGFEFILTKSGGRYRDSGDGSNCATSNCLSFTSSGSTTFDILGTSPTNPPIIDNGDSIVIYNLGTGYSPADAYASGTQINRTVVAVTVPCTTTPCTATMTPTNVFAAQSPPLPSPDSRFQIIGQNDRVVRYACPPTSTPGELTRQQGCNFANTATGCSAAARLAGSPSSESSTKASCVIDYLSAATGRNGLLYISLTLRDPSGEAVTLFQQIHVDNAP